MSCPARRETQILHALRIAGFADEEKLLLRLQRWGEHWSSVSQPELVAELDHLVESGLLRFQEVPFRAWSLTKSGRSRAETLLRQELERDDARDALGSIEATYFDFLPTNRAFLETCTAWQTRRIGAELVINDHSDEAYDASILARLHECHAEIVTICDRLSEVAERFDHYRNRFEVALCHIVEGDYDWFTKLTIDSYHTVWFELHEDLLATLGRQRSQERTHQESN